MKAEDDPFDLEKFRLRPEDLQGYAGTAAAPRARGRRRDQFTIVPKSWSDQLKAARYISTFKVAHHLLYQHWKTGGRAIALTNVALAGASVPRRSKWRALNELERLKLIKVERRPRKSPLVTLLKT
jgi:hypothetical protein